MLRKMRTGVFIVGMKVYGTGLKKQLGFPAALVQMPSIETLRGSMHLEQLNLMDPTLAYDVTESGHMAQVSLRV